MPIRKNSNAVKATWWKTPCANFFAVASSHFSAHRKLSRVMARRFGSESQSHRPNGFANVGNRSHVVTDTNAVSPLRSNRSAR
jgi:hypothetical protein